MRSVLPKNIIFFVSVLVIGALLVSIMAPAGMLESVWPGNAPLHRAVRRGDVSKIHDLVAAQPELLNKQNTCSPNPLHHDITPLMWAVVEDQRDSAEALLDLGADPDATGKFGQTPLYLAVEERNDVFVRLLLESGADPNISASNNESPLEISVKMEDSEIVDMLLDVGAEIDLLDSSALLEAVLMKPSSLVQQLLASGQVIDPDRLKSYIEKANKRNDPEGQVIASLLQQQVSTGP